MTKLAASDSGRILTAGQGGNESSLGCFVRVVWPLLGAVTLILVSSLILRRPPWTFTVLDFLYWGIVLGCVFARYADVAMLGRRTGKGEPVTVRRFALESLAIVGAGAAVWAVLHSVQVGA